MKGMARSDSGKAIAVFDGDPVIGQALVLLLQTLGYRASLLDEDSLDHHDSLKDIELLLLAPGWNTPKRERLSKELNGGTTLIPVLELGASEGGESNLDNLVPWPCRAEYLKLRIDEALYDAPGAERSS